MVLMTIFVDLLMNIKSNRLKHLLQIANFDQIVGKPWPTLDSQLLG
ncbi:hypothetical protein MICAI_440007 [Microcystis sp. T1-4]|nr:hypothetical protein MICAI_440007 [Microcystis sp. T1-4]